MISQRIGDETIRVSTPSTNHGYSSGTGTSTGQPGESRNRGSSSGTSTNTAELGRKLLLPDEILRLSDDIAIVFHKNLPVILTQLLRSSDAPEFAGPRMGKRRGGLGLAARVWAAFTLAVSVFFVGFLGLSTSQACLASSGSACRISAGRPWATAPFSRNGSVVVLPHPTRLLRNKENSMALTTTTA